MKVGGALAGLEEAGRRVTERPKTRRFQGALEYGVSRVAGALTPSYEKPPLPPTKRPPPHGILKHHEVDDFMVDAEPAGERFLIELITSDRKLKASKEGSKCRINSNAGGGCAGGAGGGGAARGGDGGSCAPAERMRRAGAPPLSGNNVFLVKIWKREFPHTGHVPMHLCSI